MPHSTTALLRVTTWLVPALGAVHGVTLVPGVRPAPGYQAALDCWLDTTVDALVICVLVRQILDLLARGLSNADIAEQLTISVHTVRNHGANLSAKLGAHSKLEVLSIAVREGVVGGG